MNHAPTFCRVWAPATVANLNVGFDALGCALKAPGEFMEFRRVSQPGVHLVNGPNTALPLEVEANVAGKAAASLLKRFGRSLWCGSDGDKVHLARKRHRIQRGFGCGGCGGHRCIGPSRHASRRVVAVRLGWRSGGEWGASCGQCGARLDGGHDLDRSAGQSVSLCLCRRLGTLWSCTRRWSSRPPNPGPCCPAKCRCPMP